MSQLFCNNDFFVKTSKRSVFGNKAITCSFLPHFWNQNLAKICEKHGKRVFNQNLGMFSTQMLVEISNIDAVDVTLFITPLKFQKAAFATSPNN